MVGIFVSYASEDRDEVGYLVSQLKSVEGFDVWFDEHSIEPGDDFIDAMRNGIRSSDVFILCLSESFEKKPPESWLNSEFKQALIGRNEGRIKRIIPVRLDKSSFIPDELGSRAFADISTPAKFALNLPRVITTIKRRHVEVDAEAANDSDDVPKPKVVRS